MGWLWSSAPKGDHVPPEDAFKGTEDGKFALTEEQRQRIFGKQASLPPPASASGTRDSDREIEAFINSWDASTDPSNASSEGTADHGPPSKYAQPRERPDGTLSINPAHLYPRTMSCRSAFDQAFYCQSLGGKFNDIYRYGHIQSCSEQWQAFWFCMRHRTLPGKNKEEIIADFHADREKRKKREFGSSEDVWELRETAVERAFWRDPDAEGDRFGKAR